jgi:hypothetical protein
VQDASRFEEATARAGRRAMAVGGVGAVVIGVVVAVLVSIVLGVVMMVVLGAAWVAVVTSSLRGARGRVLDEVVGAVGGQVVGPSDHPRLHEALAGIVVMVGVPEPEVVVLDSDAANAMVVADSDGAAVAVTRGLLEGITWVELEALAAEMLCRLRDGSARYTTLAAGLPGPLAAVAGLTPAAVADVLGDQRAVRADLDVVEVTRYPPAVISALASMQARGTEVAAAPPASAALWVAPAVGADRGVDDAVDRTTNQPLDYRIAALREL